MFGPRETVTILRDSPGGVDVYGDPVTSTTARIDVEQCLVAPNGSTESTARGSAGVSTGWTVFAPVGTDARYTDRIEIRAVTCRIDGEVADWPGDFGGVVINAVRAMG